MPAGCLRAKPPLFLLGKISTRPGVDIFYFLSSRQSNNKTGQGRKFMSQGAISIPASPTEVTQEWLSQIFGDVSSSRILTVINGTATKIQVEMDLPSQAAPKRIWIKSGMEPHSSRDGLEAVYAGESLYYRDIAGKYDTRTPACHFAATDEKGHSIIVLDDLLEQGATFVDIVSAGSPDFVARALEAIARYQASSWMAPELADNEWLRTGGSHYAYDLVSWLYTPDRWAEYSRLPRFRKLAPELRDPAILAKAHRQVLEDYCRREPWALCHGDCHFGQAYLLPDGEVRLLDWQAVQTAHWSHDVSYFMAGALSVEDRRAHERDLLRHYVSKLKEFGVPDPCTDDDAWIAYRTTVLHGIGWVMCPPEMQPEENCATMVERFSTAVLDLKSLAAIGSW